MPPKKNLQMENDIEEIRKSLNFMSGDMARVSQQLTKLTELVEEVKLLKETIREKDNTILELEKRLDNLEQYTRMEDVIITGLNIRPRSFARATATGRNVGEDAETEDLLTLEGQVLKFMKERDIHLDANDISTCHTLPQKDKTKPAIILRLVNRKRKTELLRQGRKLKGTDVYMNEHLTKKTADIAREARILRKNNKIKATWTRNCKIFIQLNGATPEQAKVILTTLAHIIACSSKKNGTSRFVTLSATSTSTNEVREVIKQAHNELRLCKRRTILFIDEIHRFNKSQQDTFLPHVENGTVTLIGATTENPSFQVNAALLSRCRVLVLEKLSVEAMGSILQRAVDTLGLRVARPEPAHLKPPDESHGQQPVIYIEQQALDTIAYLCDGDARTGLNSLQLAVQAQVSLAQSKALQGGSTMEIVVTEAHVKEGLQRSHILYDKAGEEHYNCISALHKSMRGSHENASLYWLGRMLEGGEDPLYVARRLVRFASEDVGMADPLALPQAVSAFQACHFIGMPECEVILAQCVVYLAQAPKSVNVYKAYNNVKACLRNHKGPLPPVPLHLRNAPTKLMKQLGYAKGYKYNPAFSEPVEQEYLPRELKDIDFFTWTPSE